MAPLFIVHYAHTKIGLEHFGSTQYAIGVVELLGMLVALGYYQHAVMKVGRLLREGRPEELAGFVGKVVALRLIQAAVLLVPYVYYFTMVEESIHGPVALALFFGFFTSAIDVSFIYVAEQRVFSLTVMTALARVASVLGVVLFVADPSDYILFAVLTFGVNPLVAVISFVYFVNRYSLKWPRLSHLLPEFKAALPYGVYLFLFLASLKIDLFMAESLLSPQDLGVYTGVNKLFISLVHLINLLSLVFFSESLAVSDEGIDTKVAKYSTGLLLLCFGWLILMVTFSSEILIGILIGESFQPGGWVLVISVWSLYLMSVQSVVTSQIYVKYGRMKVAIWAQIVVLVGAVLVFGFGAGLGIPAMEFVAFVMVCGRMLGVIFIGIVSQGGAEKSVMKTFGQFSFCLLLGFGGGYFLPGHFMLQICVSCGVFTGLVWYFNRGFIGFVWSRALVRLAGPTKKAGG